MQNLERDNKVLYELYTDRFGRLSIQEPKGWSNDVKSYNRDKDSRGITSKIDIDLEFFGDAASYLTDIYNTFGIEEKVLLTKYEKDRYTLSEEWSIKYIQELDMTTFKRIERTGNVTVNSTEGGLYTDIKNRESDEYDLLDNFSADGIDIGELETNRFQPLGRKIFVESLLRGEAVDYRINSYRFNRLSAETEDSVRAIPMDIVYSSSPNDVVTPSLTYSSYNTQVHDGSYVIGTNQSISDMFFYRAEQNMTIKIKFNLSYKLTKTQSQRGTGTNFNVQLFKTSKVNENDELVEVTTLQTFDPETDVNILKTITDYEKTIPLLKDESLGLVFTTTYQYDGGFGDGFMDVYVNVLNSELVIEDITAYTESITESKCIKPLNFFDRLVAKITGKTGLVKSSIFESGGDYEFMVIDNGLWARGFPDTYENGSGEEQKIQIVTSFKDAFDSFNYIEPLVWFTEIIGSTEYIRIEKATYTQKNFIGISLGDVDNIEEESSKLDYFSSVSLGHSGSLEYEELNGLDETNGKSEFSTFITKNISKYDVISKYRTDAVGYELTRRKPFDLFPKEDTKRDEKIWLHDGKQLSSGVITHRQWTDIFDSKPTGIYDPDSAWNLWLSPMNRFFYGHGYSIVRGLYHYNKKKIRFNSSNANQNLVTVKNGLSLSESGSVEIEQITPPRVEATKVSLTFNMTQLLESKFNGTTIIDNEKINNYFGLIEYNEGGAKKYGRLVKLESGEEAKLTLIKARV